MAVAASSGAIPHEAGEEKRPTTDADAIKKNQNLVVFIKKTPGTPYIKASLLCITAKSEILEDRNWE